MSKKTTAAKSGRTADGKFAKGNPHAWQKGASPNPSGRPRDTITPHLREIAQERGREVAEMLFHEAVVNHNVQAAAILLDRLDGKPRQGVDLTIDDRIKPALDAGIETLIKTGLSEEEAKAYLARFVPEISQWIN